MRTITRVTQPFEWFDLFYNLGGVGEVFQPRNQGLASVLSKAQPEVEHGSSECVSLELWK